MLIVCLAEMSVMKCQDFVFLWKKKKIKMSSAAVEIGALRVKYM